jgi:hypothetical protein
MIEQDLSPAEIFAALAALKAEVGPKAYISVSVTLAEGENSKPEIHGCVYPTGILGGGRMNMKGESWRDLIAAMNAKWEAARATYENETRRRMALAIIEITYSIGECSDNALRGHGFDASEVKRFSAAACELANTMAERGPFTVLTLNNSNEAA